MQVSRADQQWGGGRRGASSCACRAHGNGAAYQVESAGPSEQAECQNGQASSGPPTRAGGGRGRAGVAAGQRRGPALICAEVEAASAAGQVQLARAVVTQLQNTPRDVNAVTLRCSEFCGCGSDPVHALQTLSRISIVLVTIALVGVCPSVPFLFQEGTRC